MMYPIRISPFKLSGIRVGSFWPNVRSALARLPPTLIMSSNWSRNRIFANYSWRFLVSSLLMDSIPFGHALVNKYKCKIVQRGIFILFICQEIIENEFTNFHSLNHFNIDDETNFGTPRYILKVIIIIQNICL